jgi:iron complex outermembrane recepter protein
LRHFQTGKGLVKMKKLALVISAIISSQLAVADNKNVANNNNVNIETVVVTGQALTEPNTVITDPKAPRQPLPAHDGADYLKNIPGFSVTRKGGTDGDAVFRGMAGSRLGILVDGENILGGCNFRMDAPTAYIYPEIHDSLVVIKGPQSVQHGAGNSAATILFERNIERFSEPGFRLHASATAASFHRFDEVADLQLGNSNGYLQLNGTDSSADDYDDGNGDSVHSEYHRYSGLAALGWTPNDNTRVELSAARSNGEAAYADRGMDGTKFLRDSVNLRVERNDISNLIKNIKFHAYDNSVDHIMDDQELRQPGMMGYANLTRDTNGARLSSQLAMSSDLLMTVGIDTQKTGHDSRSAPPNGNYSPWAASAEISQLGIFTELAYDLDNKQRLISGYRLDQWEAKDQRAMIAMGMMNMVPNPTANETRDDDLQSYFARYERKLPSSPTTWYTGLGHSERFPDYWEMIAKESLSSISTFHLKPEETDQLDLGVLYKKEPTDLSASFFYNQTDNFILADYSNMMKMNGVSRNIKAATYGGELGVNYAITPQWKLESTLAYVRGENDTDNTALAQISPLEARLGLTYSSDKWSIGSLLRMVDSQNRFDLNKGNIVGKDLGPSSGFAIFSINANWKPANNWLLSSGIDNLFDRNYSEFISRSSGNGMGGAIPGYVQTLRVNEPGRTIWLKLQFKLD